MYIKKAKLAVFSLLSQLFSVKSKLWRYSNSVLVLPPKICKTPTLKSIIRILWQNYRNFCTVLTAQLAPKQKKNISFIWVLLGIYNFHRCPVGGQTKSGSKAPFIVLCIFCQRCLSPSQITQAKKNRDL